MYTVKMVQSNDELELAFSIRRKVFVEEQGVPVHLELDEFDKTAVHFIVYDEDQAIAAARLREIEAKIGKVERVCVLKPYRGNKLGVLIMKKVEEYAIEQNWKKLKLHAQSYAVPFYEKLDFVVTSPEFLDANIPHRAMEKNLTITNS
ncbi:GNAT family N-acetyltransferase [Lysinibacillus sp. BW-2-10]|uniref:GNAT family N-acetyltransferase n=1 Tax=Lysinibacillus sp. BW-2-10 TaxID=2590030 RepID=UPI00117E2FED|nr:GNAT family N-acetyltransferase [Lysinibacillus sp. BW-2-10]TSI04216.1 GNAT family N-acetyltransferase [Lysinibacillus sp. BW-2-10]